MSARGCRTPPDQPASSPSALPADSAGQAERGLGQTQVSTFLPTPPPPNRGLEPEEGWTGSSGVPSQNPQGWGHPKINPDWHCWEWTPWLHLPSPEQGAISKEKEKTLTDRPPAQPQCSSGPAVFQPAGHPGPGSTERRPLATAAQHGEGQSHSHRPVPPCSILAFILCALGTVLCHGESGA